MDSTGNAFLVWWQNASSGKLWVKRFVANSGWQAEIDIAADIGAVSDPDIAVDAQGNAVVVWIQVVGTQRQAWANRFATDSGWAGAGPLPMSSQATLGVPRVALDSNGRAIVVWSQSDGKLTAVWASTLQ
jgi:hypothetical protein